MPRTNINSPRNQIDPCLEKYIPAVLIVSLELAFHCLPVSFFNFESPAYTAMPSILFCRDQQFVEARPEWLDQKLSTACVITGNSSFGMLMGRVEKFHRTVSFTASPEEQKYLWNVECKCLVQI